MLQQLPDIDPNTNKPETLDLIKEMYSMCLSPDVVSALCNTNNRDIIDQVDEADQLHGTFQAAKGVKSTFTNAIRLEPDTNYVSTTSQFICFLDVSVMTSVNVKWLKIFKKRARRSCAITIGLHDGRSGRRYLVDTRRSFW